MRISDWSSDVCSSDLAISGIEPIKRSVMRTYRFPSQETKLREGGKATVPGIDGPPSTVSIEALDSDACTITLKVGVARSELLTDRMHQTDRPSRRERECRYVTTSMGSES